MEHAAEHTGTRIGLGGWLVRVIIVCFWLALACAAQVPVTVVNTSGHDRTSWCTVVIPRTSSLPGGRLELAPHGWPVVVGAPTGARGRYLHVHCTIPAHARRTGLVKRAEREPPSLPVPADVSPLRKAPSSRASPIPYLIVRTKDGTTRWRPSTLRAVETGGAGRIAVLHGKGRLPNSMLVAHVWFYVYAGFRSVPFELLVANSDFSVPDTRQDLLELAIETPPACYPAVDWLHARGGKAPVDHEGGGFRCRLSGPTWLGFGQTMSYQGRLVFFEAAQADEWPTLAAETESPLHGVCADWKGVWGPWGKMPELHPSVDGVAAALERAARFVRAAHAPLEDNGAAPWTTNRLTWWGTNDDPKDAGDQGDFGTANGSLEVLGPKGGDPVALWLMWPSVLRDAARPSFFYHADATPLDPARRPERWTSYGLWTMYHPSFSPDRLGKAKWWNWSSNTVTKKDFAHMSGNFLGAHAVLTGSYLAKHIARQETTVALAYGGAVGLGQTRAWGRVAQALTWHHLATGDPRVQQFADKLEADARLSSNVMHAASQGWRVRTRPAWDNRVRVHYWHAWHDALAIAGLDALTQVTNAPKLEALLDAWCVGWIDTAWWKHKGRWTVAHWLRYQTDALEGTPLSAERYASLPDPVWGSPHWPGTAFHHWSHPGVIISARRVPAGKLRDKANAIHADLVRQWTEGTPKRPFDRHSMWFSAVR